MQPKTHTFEIHGHQVRTRTPRRYIVVTTRPEDRHTDQGTYVAFAEVVKRTDSIEVARTTQRLYGWQNGTFRVIYDTHTGAVVS